MKKVLLFLGFSIAFQVQGQNIRKGIELTAPSESGTAGTSIVPGSANYNTLMGYNCGNSITTGLANSFYGYESGGTTIGTLVTTGSQNSYFGYKSGGIFKNSSSGNTCIGQGAGGLTPTYSNPGNQNTFIGNEAGNSAPGLSTGTFEFNTFVGARAGYTFDGNRNTVVGACTTAAPTGYYKGNDLTLIGANAKNGFAGLLSNATAIGADATVSVSNALVLGNNAKVGIGISTPTNTLHIKKLTTFGGYNLFSDSRTNSGSGCNWDNAAFIVKGSYAKGVIVGKSNNQNENECIDGESWSETFRVYGIGLVEANNYNVFSDRRFKKDIRSIEHPMGIINKLDGVSYKFDFNAENNPNNDGKPSFGFIAQEVEKVIPEAVFKNAEGYYSLNYDAIIPILTNGIKEQQKQIETQQKSIEELIALVKGKQGSDAIDNVSLNDMTSGSYLGQNVPNPFTQNTEIRYVLPHVMQNVNIGVYDLNGKEVKLYPLSTKEGSVIIEGGNLQPGMYIYALLANGNVLQSKKMVLTSQ